MALTVSSKYQVVIPKDVREALSIKAGSKIAVIIKGGIAYLVPEKTIDKLRGFIKDIHKSFPLRDKSDRKL